MAESKYVWIVSQFMFFNILNITLQKANLMENLVTVTVSLLPFLYFIKAEYES